MPKLYFNEFNDEFCFPMQHHKDYMEENELKEMVLFEAKPDIGSDFFFCKAFYFVGEKAEGGCGKDCEEYEPRNGKSGRCKFSGHCYEPTEKQITLTPSPNKQ